MKKFLILMVALSAIIFTIISTYSFICYNGNKSRLDSCDYILLGDSHTQYINEESIYNFSFSGCSFQLHEKFIKSIPLNNKKVIINVAPHNFSDQYHNRYFSNRSSHNNWRKRFFIDLPNSLELFKFRMLPKYYTLRTFNSFGKAVEINTNEQQDLSTDRLEYTLAKHFGDSTLTDTLEINAFNRIIDFLNESEVVFIIVQMPHHSTYWRRIPRRIISRYNNIIKKREHKILYDSVDERHYFDGDHILGIYQGLYLNGKILDSVLGEPVDFTKNRIGN